MTPAGKLIVRYANIGPIPYAAALRLQKTLHARAALHKSPSLSNWLLLLEHVPPVYTIGVRRNEFTQVDRSLLRSKGAEVYETDRGGLITFHGPGQLVAYPIFNLRHFNIGVRQYVDKLEQVLIATCTEFGIGTGRTENTGIWVDEKRKIAAIGVAVKQHITTHGIALNCNTDLDWFNHIVPCGLVGFGVTSITQELERNITIDEVLPILVKHFQQAFQADLEEDADDVKQLLGGGEPFASSRD